MNTTGLSNILSQCFLLVGLKSSDVKDSNSANLQTQNFITAGGPTAAYQDCNGDLCSPWLLWTTLSNVHFPPISPCLKIFSLKRPLHPAVEWMMGHTHARTHTHTHAHAHTHTHTHTHTAIITFSVTYGFTKTSPLAKHKNWLCQLVTFHGKPSRG